MLCMQKAIRDERYPDSPWVFFRHGKRIKNFRKAWDNACKAVGLWDYETGRPTKLFHDLRRTGARNLVRAGVPEKVVMLIGGWKTRSVFDRYNIIDERDIHEAARRVDKYVQAHEAARDGDNLVTVADQMNGRLGRKDRKLLN